MARSSSTSPSKSSTETSTKKQFPVQAGQEHTIVRLHIVPLTPETTASLIPASVLDETARQTLNYHTVQTSPENSYAFLDLPKDQAEKLKKRLNGTVFCGTKIRVEEARPETWVKHPQPEEPKMEYAEMTRKGKKEDKKEKRKRVKADSELKVKKRKKGEDGVLEGIELPEGRKVQRGWTKPRVPTPTSIKYAGKSNSPSVKKSEEEPKRECLFKAPLPPNKTTSTDGKKDKEEKKDKKKRKREMVIKEFKNNTKFPQFLKASQLSKDKATDTIASEYVDGVGWVNAKGDLVEEEKIKKRAATILQTGVDAPKRIDEDEVMADAAPTISKETAISVEGEGDLSSAPESRSERSNKTAPLDKNPVTTTRLDSSSESSSDSEASPSPEKISPITPITPIIPPVKRTLSSSSSNSPKITTPTLQITIPTISNSPVQVVHPLEALYKPTAKNTTLLQVGVTASPSSATAESGAFKFGFGADYDSEAEEAEPIVQTPYRERYRSAAPTPDTAVGHRKFFPDDGDDTSGYGRFGFVPSTPRVVGGFPGGQDLFSRKDATPYTPTNESPLLFPHSESRFLGALSVWSKLPTPKTLSQTEEEPAEEEHPKKDKKGKSKVAKESIAEEDAEEEEAGEKTTADVWSEKFYENRGEWNRAWKGRRREAMKQKRKREATGGPTGSKRVAT